MIKYQVEKKKKADIKEEDTVPVNSDSEEKFSRKANKREYIKLRKEISGLKDKFNHFRRTVKDDLSEIKWNLKRLFKKLSHKYTERGNSLSSDTSYDYDHFDDSSKSGDDSAHEDSSGKGKRPMTRSSSKKTDTFSTGL